jgi:RimJ/RimL family protein N-acetyltransferase
MDRPPEELTNAAVTLRRRHVTDARQTFELITESIEHLMPWMPWATPGYSLEQATEYAQRCEAEWADGSAFQYGIYVGEDAVGGAGLMTRIGDGGLEIGYWVHSAWTGRGVATAAAAALTEAALALPGIDRVEIRHDVANKASQRVPEKLGFELVGEVPSSPDMIAPGDSGTVKVWRITR